MERRQRNQKGAGANLKVEVLEAAMRLLDSRPAAALSLRMVAREAGVTAPSLYAHFPDARTLTTEIVRACWVQVGDEMTRAAQECGTPGALAVIKAQMGAYVRYAMERSSRYLLLFALQPIDHEMVDFHGLVRPAYRGILSSIECLAGEGAALPTADPVSAALLTLSLAHGRIALAHLAPSRPGNSVEGVECFVAEMLDRLFTGK